MMFGATSTGDEVLNGIDLSGRHVLVNGASSGLGLEHARVLVGHGAQVVVAVRDLGRAPAATAPITDAAGPGGGLRLIELDDPNFTRTSYHPLLA